MYSNFASHLRPGAFVSFNHLERNHNFMYLVCSLLLVHLAILIPNIDHLVSGWFFDAKTRTWSGNANAWVTEVYWLFKYSGVFYLLSLLSLIVISYLIVNPVIRKRALYALVVLIVGILIIEEGLKNNWGRARPRDILEFGGALTFSDFWMPTDQCVRNCSFSSGHAAAGFYLFVLGFIFKNKVWFIPGLVFGLLLSYVRVSMGGHFVTDVLASGIIMYLISWLVSSLMLKEGHKQFHENSSKNNFSAQIKAL